jgi:hypothetical protein
VAEDGDGGGGRENEPTSTVDGLMSYSNSDPTHNNRARSYPQ